MLSQNYSTRIGNWEKVRGLWMDCRVSRGLAGSWGAASEQKDLLDRKEAASEEEDLELDREEAASEKEDLSLTRRKQRLRRSTWAEHRGSMWVDQNLNQNQNLLLFLITIS